MAHRSIRSRLAQSDTWLLELFLGLYTLLWGLGFANPFVATFEIAPQVYSILARFPGGELPFGLMVLVFGIALLGATFSATRRVRAVIVLWNGFFWFSMMLATGIPSAWAAGGTPHFTLVAVAHWYLWARLSYQGVDG